jgi:hypothetical protein
MRDQEREQLRDLLYAKDTWVYRYLIAASVLDYLGYETRNIRQAGYPQLKNGILMNPEDAIVNFQMERTMSSPFQRPALDSPEEAKPI